VAASAATRSLRCGPTAAPPSRRRPGGPAPARRPAAAPRRARHAGEPALHLALDREPRSREGQGGLRERPAEVAHELVPRRRDRHAGLRDPPLQGAQPSRVAPPGLAQQVRAFPQESLVGRHPPSVPRIDRQHEPVQEPPPGRGGLSEQPVHHRCEPDHAQDLGELVLAAQHRPSRLTCRRSPSPPATGEVARSVGPSRASTRASTRQGPPSVRSNSAKRARRKPRPGASSETCLEQVRLAGPVLADENDRAARRVGRQLEPSVVTKVPERQATDGEARPPAPPAGPGLASGAAGAAVIPAWA
jgi:hypothetical protein